ncbi:BMP family lipoprotein [Aquibacillus rhizosphaerae]|uniref:BMP family ABC transporter substrate-binding protein n=1 Tax=Aquibacillus rhizosphaerae TaxID=3051431 RepID=A0ABT7L9N9_9BACI|nr:BMP family ABC transporter substrate-binding protein [Aquibacillus sp. LR5S19]MDL4842581.1 BMP family ABC transporter substrate-binding protein [Aquibacillus sp. LR5S19]
MYIKRLIILFFLAIFLVGCSDQEVENSIDEKVKIGIMLSDVGLGDQSFSDLAFSGLIRARDELGIIFDYRELAETETYENGLRELIEQDNDIIIGLGFMVQEDLEKVAKDHPNQQFVLIDSESSLENVISVNFKADQGSYLAGIVAAFTTETNKLGFIGGEDNPIINDFEQGFSDGAKSINPDIEILSTYANNFGDDQLGASIAKEMIEEDADVLFAAAGFTGVGALTAAQANGVYAIGVDTDQYYYAEKAVITSVQKNLDVAIFQLAETLVNDGKLATENIVLGVSNEGVGLAPLRVIEYPESVTNRIESAKQELAKGN